MNYTEAMDEAVQGARMRHSSFQPGCYVEHNFARGMLKCWPVDSPDEEPNRTQCDFKPNADDLAATDWVEMPARVQVAVMPPGNPKSLAEVAAASGWGGAAVHLQQFGRGLRPTIAVDGQVVGEIKTWKLENNLKPVPEPVAFCAECDYEKTACVCPKPDAFKSAWGSTPVLKEKSKWGQ